MPEKRGWRPCATSAAWCRRRKRPAEGTQTLDMLSQDLRYGIRAIHRSPIFSATAILTIALSCAAIATVATLGFTLLWRPLDVAHAETIVNVTATRGDSTEGVVSYADFVSFRAGTRTLSDLAAHYSVAPLFVVAERNAKEINGAVVSANYFSLLGLHPAQGRFFRPTRIALPVAMQSPSSAMISGGPGCPRPRPRSDHRSQSMALRSPSSASLRRALCPLRRSLSMFTSPQ